MCPTFFKSETKLKRIGCLIAFLFLVFVFVSLVSYEIRTPGKPRTVDIVFLIMVAWSAFVFLKAIVRQSGKKIRRSNKNLSNESQAKDD